MNSLGKLETGINQHSIEGPPGTKSNTMRTCGIYAITCQATGKKYIGSSTNIAQRWSSHRMTLSKNVHRNGYLQNSWNKYGSVNFIFEILEECQPEIRIVRELFWIDLFKPEFNLSVPDQRLEGFQSASETRRKQSVANKGKPFSEEHRRNLSKAALQRLTTDEGRLQLLAFSKSGNTSPNRKSQKGKVFSEERRRKMSESAKRRVATEKGRLQMLSLPRNKRIKHEQP